MKSRLPFLRVSIAFILLVPLALLCSCGSAEPSDPVSGVQFTTDKTNLKSQTLSDLERDLSITSLSITPDGKWIFGRPAIPDAYGGAFFRLSAKPGSQDLSFYGNNGQGPGEFALGPQIVHVWNEFVFVKDASSSIHVFSTDGKFLFKFILPGGFQFDNFQFEDGLLLTFLDNDASLYDPDINEPRLTGHYVFSEFRLDPSNHGIYQNGWLDYKSWIKIKQKYFYQDLQRSGTRPPLSTFWISPTRMVAFCHSSEYFLIFDTGSKEAKPIKGVFVFQSEDGTSNHKIFYSCGSPEPATGDFLLIEPHREQVYLEPSGFADYAVHRFSSSGTHKGRHLVSSRHNANEAFVTPMEAACDGRHIFVSEIVETVGGEIGSRLVRIDLPEVSTLQK